MIIISRLGGALNRSKKEPPGPQTLLRGLRRLQDITFGAQLMNGEVVDLIVTRQFKGYAQA